MLQITLVNPLGQHIGLRRSLRSHPLHARTDIRLKVLRLDAILKHLMYRFQRSISRLWQKEDGKQNEQRVGAEPNVPVFGAPAELSWIYEIRRCKCSEPVADKI